MKRFQFVCIFGAVLCLVGCETPADNTNSNDNSSGNTNDNTGNDSLPAGFESAVNVEVTEADFVYVDNASIDSVAQLDIYNLGALNVGDRLEVRCVPTEGSDLDPMMALFDGQGQRVFWNDDVNPLTSNFIAAFQGNIRHTSSNYLLVVTSSNLPQTTGGYELTVQLTPDVDAPINLPQTFVLNWASAQDVVVDSVDYGNLPEFNSSDIGSDFAGLTDSFKEQILNIVRNDFADFDIEIVTTDDDLDSDLQASHIYFADFSDGDIYSRVDGVDFYNGQNMDNAILFLPSFNDLTSDPDAMAQAIANIVSREVGRLLGLMLTDNVTSIMDKTESNDIARASLLDDRELGTFDLFEFPLGEQNDTLLLQETVGLQ